ncbi:MAG: MFS transporter [Rhodospirillaceae bacterium]|jgi:MFS transporter, UMF1 family|nr:MFS transporter [Rhodospirillaceae bacterium]
MTEPNATASRRAQFSWCFFDWANSAFPTVIVTFVFATYFTEHVATSKIEGTAQWGYALALSGVAIALLSPVVGAIADKRGGRKPWIAFFSLVCVTCSGLLWFTLPDPGWVVWGLTFFALGNLSFEVGTVFYNSMLPTMVPQDRIGRLSGWGWGLGYFGGIACLLVIWLAFASPEKPPFGLDPTMMEHIRIAGPFVALWFFVFAYPLFLFTPDTNRSGLSLREAARLGLAGIAKTIRSIREHANIARFLVARLFFIDGLNTLFAFGGIYAAGTFGMDFGEILQFAIALNVAAGIGSMLFAWIDDRIGSKRTVMIALLGIIVVGTPILLVTSKMAFWVLALGIGIFMGPAQAASRTLMARMAPADQITEMFGLFALSGKVTAFMGPAVLAWVTTVFASQRAGMTTVIVFIAIGAAILVTVKDPGK